METVIRTERLRKTFKSRLRPSGPGGRWKSLFAPVYKTTTAVDDISFSVRRGELLAFIGPNGAGKSTTIKIITGVLFPDGGRVSVLDMDPRKQRRKLAYRIGAVFGQKSQLWFHLPPLDSFRLLADIYDLPAGKASRS